MGEGEEVEMFFFFHWKKQQWAELACALSPVPAFRPPRLQEMLLTSSSSLCLLGRKALKTMPGRSQGLPTHLPRPFP